jgi:hypothetical protein
VTYVIRLEPQVRIRVGEWRFVARVNDVAVVEIPPRAESAEAAVDQIYRHGIGFRLLNRIKHTQSNLKHKKTSGFPIINDFVLVSPYFRYKARDIVR